MVWTAGPGWGLEALDLDWLYLGSFFLAVCGMGDICSLTGDRTHGAGSGGVGSRPLEH